MPCSRNTGTNQPSPQKIKTDQTANLCIHADADRFELFVKLGTLLASEQRLPNMNFLFVEKLLESFFIKLLYLDGQSHTEIISSPMQKAISYIHEHFAESPPLTEVAEHLHYNPRYFSSAFKKAHHVSYLEYVNRLKINQAKKMLMGTKNTISFISDACGFASLVTFRRVFKAHCGMTPGEFRTLMLPPKS